MASFYITDEKWRKKQEITLVEMDTYSDEGVHDGRYRVGDFLETRNRNWCSCLIISQNLPFIELSEIPG